MGMGGFPPVSLEQEDFSLVHWNLKKWKEPERYEVHSLRERHDEIKVESNQPFSQPIVDWEQTHGIHVQIEWDWLETNFD